MQEQLIFLIGPPRAGTTLLARMLGSHSQICAPPEPHLITPLAHLGFHARVDAAPYDPVITQNALQELVEQLPGGESDYLEALRACSDSIYQKLLQQSGCERLLDKTPAYALVLDFLVKLYPSARYVVLTRNPLAVWSSYVSSFFDGDHRSAHAHNPLLERYVPAIARFLRQQPASIHHLRYEELVAEPSGQLAAVCDFLGLEFEPGIVDYGASAEVDTPKRAGLGDPITVARETRPTTQGVDRWTEEIAGNPDKLAQCSAILERLLDEDLKSWGFARSELEAQLAGASAAVARPRSRLNRYALQRRLLVRLRRNIHHNAFGRLVRRVRLACDVLLR